MGEKFIAMITAVDRDKVQLHIKAGKDGPDCGMLEFLYETFQCFYRHTEEQFEWEGLHLVDLILRSKDPAAMRASYNRELEMAIKRDELSKLSSK